MTVIRQRTQVHKWESIQVDCEGDAYSIYSIVYFSIYVLLSLPDNGRMEGLKHVVRK